MRLLVITQKVDREDPILGFFHNWIHKLSSKFEFIHVICLEKGKFDLPQNVKIYSLGKESGKNKIQYILKFFHLCFFSSIQYDSVFVHMNQEYVLLGGMFWKIMGKKIFMWRNHAHGNFLTPIAVWLSDRVFCTSKYAFVAKYKKTEIMPVGIDINQFKLKAESLELRVRGNKILFLGRMSPIKRPDLLIETLNILNKKNTDFVCNFYGDPLLKDQNYYDSLNVRVKELRLDNKINFYKAVANYKTPEIYNEHGIFINLTPSGSLDKTILEAAACGCLLVIANKSLSGEIDERMITEENPDSIAQKIEFWLNIEDEERKTASEKLQKYVLEKHSLDTLVNRLSAEIKR